MTSGETLLKGGRIEDADPDFGYLPGFGNHHSTEAEAGALPIGRNSPQRPPLGLYAEVLSGTAFTAPRAANRRSWLYRILPSVRHGQGFEEVDAGRVRTAPCRESALPAMPLRWHPIPVPSGGRTDFLAGLRTIATGGDAAMQAGIASHVFVADASMDRRYFQDADGELLVVPQQGRLRFLTELGILVAEPGEVVLIPRGVRFRIELPDGPARGYVCENYGTALTLPERGPIGANGLANERDFLYPAAAYEDVEAECELLVKTRGADVPGGAAPLSPRRGGLAREPRALQVRPSPLLPPSARPSSTTPTRRSSPSSPPRRTPRAPPTSTSSSSPSAGS